MIKLLFVSHCPSENTRILRDSAVDSICKMELVNLELRTQAPELTTAADIEWCHGIVLGTTENFGYMAGLTKDFFERIYYPCLELTQGLPIVLYIRAGEDGTGTKISIERILAGLRWKLIADPLILKGNWDTKFPDQVSELAMTIAAGLDAGIY